MDRRKRKMLVAAAMVMGLVLVLTACEQLVPQDPTPLPEVEEAALMAVSDETGIAVEDMEAVDVERSEWPDACLGLGEPDEVCAQVITPGWQVTILAEGEEYVVRTDDFGEEVRIED